MRMGRNTGPGPLMRLGLNKFLIVFLIHLKKPLFPLFRLANLTYLIIIYLAIPQSHLKRFKGP
jgi:hypothetical protein